MDHIAQRMKQQATNCKLVTAAPVVGYFLDHANYKQEHPPPPADQQSSTGTIPPRVITRAG